MTKELIDMLLGLARHGMTTAGGALVANGLVTQDELASGIGAVLTLVGIGLSIYNKRKAK